MSDLQKTLEALPARPSLQRGRLPALSRSEWLDVKAAVERGVRLSDIYTALANAGKMPHKNYKAFYQAYRYRTYTPNV